MGLYQPLVSLVLRKYASLFEFLQGIQFCWFYWIAYQWEFCSADVYHEKREVFEREAGQCFTWYLIIKRLHRYHLSTALFFIRVFQKVMRG